MTRLVASSYMCSREIAEHKPSAPPHTPLLDRVPPPTPLPEVPGTNGQAAAPPCDVGSGPSQPNPACAPHGGTSVGLPANVRQCGLPIATNVDSPHTDLPCFRLYAGMPCLTASGHVHTPDNHRSHGPPGPWPQPVLSHGKPSNAPCSGVPALRARLTQIGREDAIDLTKEEPDVKPDPGPLAAKDLVVTVVAMLDKHLPASEVPMLADAYTCMEEWLSSPYGAAQLEALRKAYAATLLKCAGMSSTMIAWILWKSIQRLLEQPPAQTPALNAVGSGAVPSPVVAAAPSKADLTPRPATDGRPSKRTRSGQAGAGSQAKRQCGGRRRVLSHAADQNQGMATLVPLPGAEAPPPLALQMAPGARPHGQAPVTRDGAGPSSAPGPATAHGSMDAADLVAAAGPGVDPLPRVQEWGTYRVGARCFEVVQKPIVKQLGLNMSEPGSRVPILVALALEQTGQTRTPG
ncbi:hypothetical protein HaLaN_03322, partial [Haematococcus lacustris]